jgi:hypothetical protein
MHHVAPSSTVSMLSGAVDGRRASTSQGDHPGSVFEFDRGVRRSFHLPAMRRDQADPVVGRMTAPLTIGSRKFENDAGSLVADGIGPAGVKPLKRPAGYTLSSQPIVGPPPCSMIGFKMVGAGRCNYKWYHPDSSQRPNLFS